MSAPPNPRADRQRWLTVYLRIASILVLAAAGVGALVPGDIGERAAIGMVGLLVAVPLGRALWLAVRWWHRGDRRFALLAVTLLLLVATGAALATA